MANIFDLTKLRENPDNPRKKDPDKYPKLLASLKKFPKMLALRPLVYDPETMYVLGGNMRLEALRELGYNGIPKSWVRSAEDLTEEEKREFIIKDNLSYGLWDWQLLDEDWSGEALDDWGLDFPEEEMDLDLEDEVPEPKDTTSSKMATCPKCGFIHPV